MGRISSEDPAESDGLRPLFATYTVTIKPEPVSLGAKVGITTLAPSEPRLAKTRSCPATN